MSDSVLRQLTAIMVKISVLKMEKVLLRPYFFLLACVYTTIAQFVQYNNHLSLLW